MSPEVPVTNVATPVAATAPKLYPDEIALGDVETITGLSGQRLRKLLKEGKITSQAKNADGRWRFSEAKVKEWAANRPKGTRQAADGKKAVKMRLTDAQIEAIKKVIPDIVIESAFNYNATKAKEYRAKRFAAQKAAKVAAANAAGVPVAATKPVAPPAK